MKMFAKSSFQKFPKWCAAIAACVMMASCASGPNARTGTVVGGLGGAALGGIIGHQSGRGLEGAAIGGALGALGGNMIGDSHDQRYYGRRYYSDRGYYPDRGYYNRRPYGYY